MYFAVVSAGGGRRKAARHADEARHEFHLVEDLRRFE